MRNKQLQVTYKNMHKSELLAQNPNLLAQSNDWPNKLYFRPSAVGFLRGGIASHPHWLG